MFIGALVLFFSGLLIASSTSLPVYNKIISYFNPEFIGLAINDPIEHYNKYQLWIALFISLISGSAILLRYKEFNWDKRKRKYAQIIGMALGMSILLDWLFSMWIDIYAWQYHLLSISAFFIIFINVHYLIKSMSFNLKATGSVISHIGFGLMIIGIMASGLSKRYISSNPFAQRGLLDEDLIKTNIILVKEKPMFMNDYWVEYERDTFVDKLKYFKINFRKVNDQNETLEEFSLFPDAQMSNDLTKVAAFNPDTRHTLLKDIFVSISSLPRPHMDIKFAKEMEDTLKFTSYDLKRGDRIEDDGYTIELVDIRPGTNYLDSVRDENDLSIIAEFNINDKRNDTVYVKSPSLILDGLLVYSVFKEVPSLNMRIQIRESFFDKFYTPDNLLEYKEYKFIEGETRFIDGFNVSLKGFNREVEHDNYQKQEGDIAIAANLDFTKVNDDGSNGNAFRASPIYIIRNSRPFSIKSYNHEYGIHSRLKNIDPTEGIFTFGIATEKRDFDSIPIEVSTNVPRSDLIVLEAIEFPGINFLWLGTILMMTGFLVSLIHRSRKKYSA